METKRVQREKVPNLNGKLRRYSGGLILFAKSGETWKKLDLEPVLTLTGKHQGQDPIISGHPTVKPTAMLEDALIDISNRGDIVIDPFLGSGSTLVAAHETGRICYVIEIDPRYVDLIIKRYEEVSGQQAKLLVGE